MGPRLSADTMWTRKANVGSLQITEVVWEFVWCISWTKSLSSLVRAGGRSKYGKSAEMPSRYEPLCWECRAWLSHASLMQSPGQWLNFMSRSPGTELTPTAMVGRGSGWCSRLAFAEPDQELPHLPLFPLLATCSAAADGTDLAMLGPSMGHAFLHLHCVFICLFL